MLGGARRGESVMEKQRNCERQYQVSRRGAEMV